VLVSFVLRIRWPVGDSHFYSLFLIARRHGLSAYDALYLALALELGAILATNDRQLVRAALAEGIELRSVLGPSEIGV